MAEGMSNNQTSNTNFSDKKKQTIIVTSIICISVAVIVIAASLVYNYFFKDNIIKEKKQKIASQQMEEILQRDQVAAADAKKQSTDIIKKHNLDIYGSYVTTFNEIVEDRNQGVQGVQGGATETQTVTLGMMVNDDMTLNFSDGKKGWWVLTESEDGIVHMGIGKDGAKNMEMLILADDGSLINLSSAVFFGEIPSEEKFEKTYESAGLTLDFKKDGTIDGEYYEIVKENDKEYPWTEVYRGEYRKNDKYIDIVLNGSPARYMIFGAKTSDSKKTVTGFASSYYLKTED